MIQVESKSDVSSRPPAAYQVKTMDLPNDPVDIHIDSSFEAMYEPAAAYRYHKYNDHNDDVKTAESYSESQEAPPLLKGKESKDGDSQRQSIKNRIAAKEEIRAKMKRKQSKTTAFDAKQRNSNLWGRKLNEFPTKVGKQGISDWRFLTPSDDVAHTLVLQHEQIKKKKKSKRMVILDGDEKYSDKSKKTEWKLICSKLSILCL